MAQKVLVSLTDDMDGSDATATVPFALDGTAYEIDLNDKNAAKLRKALEPYVAKARRVKRAGRPAPRLHSVAVGPDPAAVRAWAGAHGVKVSPRGRIPHDVVERYAAAGN